VPQPGAAPTASEAGDGSSVYLLGVQYLLGDGVDQNLRLANDCLHRAAVQGHPEAIETLRHLNSGDAPPRLSWPNRHQGIIAILALAPLAILLAWLAVHLWLGRQPETRATRNVPANASASAVLEVAHKKAGGIHGKRR
jgi:TPR repeat protein